jgi:hypothetical protein
LISQPLIGLLYQLRMTDDDECGAVGGMRIVRGNRSTRTKPAPVPLRPPEIPHDLSCVRTRAAAVRRRRLTARPKVVSYCDSPICPFVYAGCIWPVPLADRPLYSWYWALSSFADQLRYNSEKICVSSTSVHLCDGKRDQC